MSERRQKNNDGDQAGAMRPAVAEGEGNGIFIVEFPALGEDPKAA